MAFQVTNLQDQLRGQKLHGSHQALQDRGLGHVGLHHCIPCLREEDQEGYHHMEILCSSIHVVAHVTGQGVDQLNLNF